MCHFFFLAIMNYVSLFQDFVTLCNIVSSFGFLVEENGICDVQSYWEITSDAYLDYIKDYVVGIGPWKDTVVPVKNNYLQTPTDLVAKAHAHNLQVISFLISWFLIDSFYINGHNVIKDNYCNFFFSFLFHVKSSSF